MTDLGTDASAVAILLALLTGILWAWASACQDRLDSLRYRVGRWLLGFAAIAWVIALILLYLGCR